jgi:ABC-type nitrate/sulfonate/bicarbonate transport system substrate-binding protein
LAFKGILKILIGIVLIIVTVTALIIYMRPSSNPRGDQLESVTVGAEFIQVNTLLLIAQKMGYFSDNGLNVTIRPYITGAAALGAMVNDEVNIAASSEFSVVKDALANSSLSIIGTIDRFELINIVARKDRGIQNITDLANKSVGLTVGTSSEFFFGRFLELNKMNLSWVKIVDTQPNNIVKALTNGSVDAVVTWQPYLNQIDKLMPNDSVVEWSAQSGQQVYCVLSATDSWINIHNKTVTQFLEAIAQAESYLQSNPVDAENIIKNQLNYTTEYIESIWPENQFTLSLDQSLVLIMEDEARWLIANNLTNATSVTNFQNYIYKEGLAQVKPDSMTIVW